jgi:hypothetical protein
MGIARKNQPNDTAIKRHLEGLIEQSKGFSPHLFSKFLYRDFNDDGWGLIRKDGSRDPRIEVLRDNFTEEVVLPTYEKVLSVRVRASHHVDAGIQLLNKGQDPILVTIAFWGSVGRWDPKEEEFAGTESAGVLRGSTHLTLGPMNPVAFNITEDLDLDMVDAVLIVSESPIDGLSVWVTKAGHSHNYAGFPPLS